MKEVGGGGAARKKPHMKACVGHTPASKIYSQVCVEHTSARGDWEEKSLVASDDGDG